MDGTIFLLCTIRLSTYESGGSTNPLCGVLQKKVRYYAKTGGMRGKEWEPDGTTIEQVSRTIW